jgi:hypothetical protein
VHTFDWSGTALVPDTVLIAFASSNFEDSTFTPGVGSVLIVDDVRLEAPVGVLDLSNAQGVYFWPVPADDVLNLSIQTKQDALTGAVRLFDVLGNVALAQVISGPADNIQLDVSSFPTGTYVWEVELNGQVYSGQVLVESFR